MRVTLNAVGDNGIRTISKKTLDAFAHHTLTQSIRSGRMPDFGVNLEQDLVQAITGAPSDPALGIRLVGKDALGVLTRATLPAIPAALVRYAAEFESVAYKHRYPNIDQIAEENDPLVIRAIEGALIKKLVAGDFDRLWLAVPDFVDWGDLSGFRFTEKGKDLYDDLHIADFMEHVRTPTTLTVQRLKQRHVDAVFSRGRPPEGWSVFRCMHFEHDHKGTSYVLSGGRWFRLKRDFVERVDTFVDPLLSKMHRFPASTTSEDEVEYNKRAAKLPGHVLMDRVPVAHGGGPSQVEFCDVFNRQRQMVHVKRYSGSGVLSHLFAQGAVAAETLLLESSFRTKVRAKLPPSHRSLIPSKRPRPEDFAVIFGIIARPPGSKRLSQLLPFFSRVTLRHVTQRLQGFGFNVEVAWIPNA